MNIWISRFRILVNPAAEGQPSHGSLWLLSAVLLFCPLRAAGQSWNWSKEQVDLSAKATAIAVDADENIHISYAGDGGSVLKYAFRPARTDHWFTMVLDKQLQEFATQIAVDSQGQPRICYTPRELRFALFDGKKWNIQQIAAGMGTVEYNCTVTIAPDNTPHVIWYHTRAADGTNYLHLKYATLKEGVWLSRTVDFEGEDGKWNSMVVDSSGRPQLIYSVFPRGELKYASLDGDTWNTRSLAVSTNGAAGMGNSLVLDAQGRPEFAFYDASVEFGAASKGSLKFARSSNSGPIIETVDSVFQKGGWVGFRSSLVLDKHGFPHICYEDAGSVKHAFWDGTRWHIQVVVPRATEPYLYSSMAIDKNDVIYISYRDSSDGSLKVAIGRGTAQPSPTTAVRQNEKE